MEKLFTNYNEYIDFTNALAYRRTKKLVKANNLFDEEIADALEKCGKIFEENGSDINFIAEIIDLEMKIQNNENQSMSSVDLDELSLRRESLYNKYNIFLEKLPLEIKENLEFYFKKVFDRKLRSNHTLELINQIKTEYPKAEDLTVIEIMNQPIFQSIESALSKEQVVEVEEPKIEETANLPYVVQIKKAPESLTKEPKVEVDSKPIELEEEKNIEPSLEIPNLFMNEEEPKQDEPDKIIPFFNEIPEQKTDKIEVKEEPIFEETKNDDFFTAFENIPSLEEITKEEPKTEIIKEEKPVEEDKLTYTMEKGDSLTNIAKAICDDENGWYDIFEANKQTLKDRIKEKGLSENDPFENNEDLFTGLTLIIPNVYEKGRDSVQLAA